MHLIKSLFLSTLKSWHRALHVVLLSLCLPLSLYAAMPPLAWAAVAPSQQPVETVTVHLGNESGNLVFDPDQLTFTAGKHYKLHLDNPSPTKHYFTAKDFADSIWTQKVEAGQVEVKGAVHELELRPGAAADWVFVPQKPGSYELHCSVSGHAESGMVGLIDVR